LPIDNHHSSITFERYDTTDPIEGATTAAYFFGVGFLAQQLIISQEIISLSILKEKLLILMLLLKRLAWVASYMRVEGNSDAAGYAFYADAGCGAACTQIAGWKFFVEICQAQQLLLQRREAHILLSV